MTFEKSKLVFPCETNPTFIWRFPHFDFASFSRAFDMSTVLFYKWSSRSKVLNFLFCTLFPSAHAELISFPHNCVEMDDDCLRCQRDFCIVESSVRKIFSNFSKHISDNPAEDTKISSRYCRNIASRDRRSFGFYFSRANEYHQRRCNFTISNSDFLLKSSLKER